MTICQHCSADFTPKPRRNRHGLIGEPQSARYCWDRCRLRAYRGAKSKGLDPKQDAPQAGAEAVRMRETALDHVPLPARYETALETPPIRASKPLPKGS
jgi:hypothetical protein